MPEVNDANKNFDPNIQAEKQTMKPLKGNEVPQEKPRIGQGRVGLRRRKPNLINLLFNQLNVV